MPCNLMHASTFAAQCQDLTFRHPFSLCVHMRFIALDRLAAFTAVDLQSFRNLSSHFTEPIKAILNTLGRTSRPYRSEVRSLQTTQGRWAYLPLFS